MEIRLINADCAGKFPTCRSQPAVPRRGVVLLAVMVVVAILTLAAAPFVLMTMAELKSSLSAVKMAQARAVADSGVHYVMALIASPDNITDHAGGNLFDNSDAFKDVAVPGIPGATFSIIAAPDASTTSENGMAYGLIDESGKISIPAAMVLDPTGELLYNMLLKLPNMTDAAANAIVDWVDPDSEPRNNGAENDHYAGKSPPYHAKNGPLDSLEELLLVEGVTRELLFGSDLNRNARIDPEEEGGPGGLGWSAFLTVHSRFLNVDAKGQALINLNGDDVAKACNDVAAAGVDADMATYIALYRRYGASSTQKKEQTSSRGDGGGGGGKQSPSSSTMTVKGSLSDLSIEQVLSGGKATKKINSLFDLVNSQVSVPDPKQKDVSVVYSSPLNDVSRQRDLLPKLFEKATTSKDVEGPARINVNTAPRDVLLALTGIPNSGFTESEVESMMGVRPSAGGSSANTVFQSPGWLLTEANIKIDTLKKIEKYITTRSQVYRVHVTGRIGNGPSARLEAVIDANAGRPRLLFWRDLTEAGGAAVGGGQ